ncbi:hypothetical protein FQN54_007028 [Arachnomyces sp. PD_36]|nr:hypothetical protein FQN54_007028 [Arachnomyces sp. PD_36]
MPLIWQEIKKVTFVVENAIKSLFTFAAKTDEALQVTEIELQNIEEQEIAQSAEIVVEEAMIDGVAIASEFLFIGACVILAVIFIGLFFILHNSYRHVRIWNLTKYNMEWGYFIDHELFEEGQITSAPIDFKTNKTVRIPNSHEFTRIRYTLQLYLRDPKTDKTVYTVTTYYDIPFSGDNSTNLTFGDVSDPHSWFKDNFGNNKSTIARSQSGEGAIPAVSTYDYLDGKHGVPSQTGGSSNEAYYYMGYRK